MQITLSEEEQALLSDILEQYHRELLNEIAHTDHREFKQRLLRNEEIVESLVCRIRGTAVRQAGR